MYKVLALVALAFGVASAQRWPMITVNAAGEIVLQSLTRAQSFQVTPAAATTAPSTSGIASLATATALTAGVSAFVITTATSPAGGHGVTLPAPTVGAQVTLIQSQTSFVSYTIYSSATTIFINNDASTASITALSRRVVCQAISTTRWNCVADTVDAPQQTVIRQVNTYLSSVTTFPLAAAHSGSVNYVTSSLAFTLPACTVANVGITFDFIMISAAVASALTIKTASTSDLIQGHATGGATPFYSVAVSAGTLTITENGTGAFGSGTSGQAQATVTCVAFGRWIGNVLTTTAYTPAAPGGAGTPPTLLAGPVYA